MKRLMLAALLTGALCACGDAAEDADATAAAAEDAAPPPAETTAAMVTANGSKPGLFEVTAADGTVTQSELMADGTYADHGPDGKVTAAGTWSVADGKTCFDPEGDEATTCYTETAPDADGNFTASGDDGEVLTVRWAG